MEDGNDAGFGENGPDYIYAGNGNDTLYGGQGPDVLLGEAGNDFLFGGGSDMALGEADYLFGGGAPCECRTRDSVASSSTITARPLARHFISRGFSDWQKPRPSPRRRRGQRSPARLRFPGSDLTR
jgi:hypothetical protein